MSIEVKNLSVTLSGREILRDVSFSVEQGKVLGLLGPNGAGKTTLLRALQGLIPCQGSVTIGGKSGGAVRPLIGYVPQKQGFNWDFPIDVAGVVQTGLTGKGMPRLNGRARIKAIKDALELVQLGELATRVVGELSGGQKQRVLLARALVTKPAVLLLDEPLTGLDAPGADSLMQLLRRLAEGGTTTIMSTHDLGGALVYCDQVMLLNGQTIAHGAPSELCDKTPWQETFNVSEESALLQVVGAK
ncbi:MAG: anchored repeat-type ABC transporter ATP-binding subunit [Actinomycetaceae bacterium]|nr:anchored repeat-type ABC transporter ATP-binding subunit [Actinomycetaceae bacterium]